MHSRLRTKPDAKHARGPRIVCTRWKTVWSICVYYIVDVALFTRVDRTAIRMQIRTTAATAHWCRSVKYRFWQWLNAVAVKLHIVMNDQLSVQMLRGARGSRVRGRRAFECYTVHTMIHDILWYTVLVRTTERAYLQQRISFSATTHSSGPDDKDSGANSCMIFVRHHALLLCT